MRKRTFVVASRVFSLVAVIVVVWVLLFLPGVVRATMYTKTLAANYNFWVEMGDLTEGDSVDFTLTVNGSGKVDVLWMNYGQWEDYDASRSFDFDDSRSSLNVSSASDTIDVSRDNNYIMVIDNTKVPDGGAVPTGQVSFDLEVEIFRGDSTCCFSGFLMVLPVGLVLSLTGIISRVSRRFTKDGNARDLLD